MKIDTSEWKEFSITELFDLSLPRGDLQVKKVKDGDVPLITPSNYNNGLLKRISAKSNSTKYPANTLTVDMFGNAYYHDEEYFVTAHGHVNVLLPKFKINRNIGCFIATTLKAMFKSKYTFSEMCTQKVLKREILFLPVSDNGEPNWDYMNAYMEQVFVEVMIKLEKLTETRETKHAIAVDKWGEFKVGDLLVMQSQIELNPIEAFKKNKSNNDVKYPFYGQSSENNGIIDYYYLGEELLNNKEGLPSIMIHSNTHRAYYVDTPFYLKDGHGATTIFTQKDLSYYATLFLIAVLNKTMDEKFDYDIKATKERLKELTVRIPIKKDGKPNWDYMEEYMKNIMNKTNYIIDVFSAV